MIPIDIGPPEPTGPPFLRDGFRPFFLGATTWAVLCMAPWWASYALSVPMPRHDVAGMQWHAHEMIFGFSGAVVAGFLLTAVRRWTGRPTLSGRPLLALWAAWMIARLTFMAGWVVIWIPALADLAFGAGLVFALAVPIRASGQLVRQAGVLSKVATLTLANALFFAGALGWLDAGLRWGLYLGFFALLGLVLEIGRRIIPGFVAIGTGARTPPRNHRWIDRSALVLYLLLVVAHVFLEDRPLIAISASLLALVHGIRAAGWYAAGIWGRPLIWSLMLSYWFTVAGFALLALGHVMLLPPLVGIHALGVGGIGMIAAGMMARVSLGHTGRSITDLPGGTAIAFGVLLAAAVSRVALPIAVPLFYQESVILSQSLWMIAFAVLAMRFAGIWTGPSARLRHADEFTAPPPTSTRR